MKNNSLTKYYKSDDILEIGIDEAGRGPMFGRLYTAGVVLPKDESFQHNLMCDSKKIKSFKKLQELSDYIKKNAIAWSVNYEDSKIIDKINIRQSVLNSMQLSARMVIKELDVKKALLLVDGNDFKPYLNFTAEGGFEQISHTCIEGGDNKYAAIAAASILAKVERDRYISEICEKDPTLEERYDLLKNKGYGTKKHMDGIKTYGISKHHRKTFGICREYS